MKKRNPNIDLIKIISCIAVIGLHSFMPSAKVLYYACGFAVPLFFMSNGYFVLNKSKITGGGYWIRKIFSIFRIVFIWNLLRALAGILVGKSSFAEIFDLIIKQTFLSLVQKGNMPHFWYMAALIIIYILMFLWSFSKRKIIMQGKTIYFFAWCMVLIFGMVMQIDSIIYHQALQRYVIQTFRLWSWIQYFILGGMIPHIYMAINDTLSIRKHAILLFFSLAFMVCYQYWMGKYVINTLYAEYFYDSIFMVGEAVIMFTFLLRVDIAITVQNCILRVSELTLGIYIIHPVVLSYFVRNIINLNSAIGALLRFTLTLFLSFVFVWAMNKSRFIKKWLLTL